MLKPLLLAGILAFAATPALADPDKDESGHGSYREWDRGDGWYDDDRRHRRDRWNGDDRGWDRDRGDWRWRRHARRIPNGHLPPPGECRVWYPDRPAGHQPPPERCY